MVFTLLLSQFYRRLGWVRVLLGGAILVLLGIIVYGAQKPPRVTYLDPITKVIEVPVDKITTKVVKEYVRVEDRVAVNSLLKENKKLQSTVEQLTASLASSTSTGRGTTTITFPTDPAQPSPFPSPLEVPMKVSFKDWRLNFESNGSDGRYTLTQRYSILNTVGRNKENVPVNLIRLFEIGERGERIPIPVTETTTIAVQPNQPHTYIKPQFQGGVAFFAGTENVSSPAVTVAIPWLHRGTVRAAEYTRYAFFTPMVTVSSEEKTVGAAPLSLNLGTLKYTPFQDVWVSPYGGINPDTSTKRFALVFTTTF
jgi:hypothetical protein